MGNIPPEVKHWHDTGLIMISKTYYQHVDDDRFIKSAQVMGMPDADKAKDFLTILDKL